MPHPFIPNPEQEDPIIQALYHSQGGNVEGFEKLLTADNAKLCSKEGINLACLIVSHPNLWIGIKVPLIALLKSLGVVIDSLQQSGRNQGWSLYYYAWVSLQYPETIISGLKQMGASILNDQNMIKLIQDEKLRPKAFNLNYWLEKFPELAFQGNGPAELKKNFNESKWHLRTSILKHSQQYAEAEIAKGSLWNKNELEILYNIKMMIRNRETQEIQEGYRYLQNRSLKLSEIASNQNDIQAFDTSWLSLGEETATFLSKPITEDERMTYWVKPTVDALKQNNTIKDLTYHSDTSLAVDGLIEVLQTHPRIETLCAVFDGDDLVEARLKFLQSLSDPRYALNSLTFESEDEDTYCLFGPKEWLSILANQKLQTLKLHTCWGFLNQEVVEALKANQTLTEFSINTQYMLSDDFVPYLQEAQLIPKFDEEEDTAKNEKKVVVRQQLDLLFLGLTKKQTLTSLTLHEKMDPKVIELLKESVSLRSIQFSSICFTPEELFALQEVLASNFQLNSIKFATCRLNTPNREPVDKVQEDKENKEDREVKQFAEFVQFDPGMQIRSLLVDLKTTLQNNYFCHDFLFEYFGIKVTFSEITDRNKKLKPLTQLICDKLLKDKIAKQNSAAVASLEESKENEERSEDDRQREAEKLGSVLFVEATKLEDAIPDVYWILGNIFKDTLKDYSNAIKAYSKIKSENPHYTEAQNQCAHLLLLSQMQPSDRILSVMPYLIRSGAQEELQQFARDALYGEEGYMPASAIELPKIEASPEGVTHLLSLAIQQQERIRTLEKQLEGSAPPLLLSCSAYSSHSSASYSSSVSCSSSSASTSCNSNHSSRKKRERCSDAMEGVQHERAEVEASESQSSGTLMSNNAAEVNADMSRKTSLASSSQSSNEESLGTQDGSEPQTKRQRPESKNA